MRDGDLALLARYDALFAASRVAVRDLTAVVVDGATQLRRPARDRNQARGTA